LIRAAAAQLLKPHGQVLNLRHHSLVAWQRADDLFIKLHKLTIQSFPSYERFEVGQQLRRAAYSVARTSSKGMADGTAVLAFIS
jgi:hypothetical protein